MAVKRVGVLGSGQLGRMMALAGIPLDVEFVFFDEGENTPSHCVGKVINPKTPGALQTFINMVDVVTYESENTDAGLVEGICKHVAVFPGPDSLRKSQHRLTEKDTFRSLGIATAEYRRVTSREELKKATQELGFPIVLKTTTMGYDGKGQAVLRSASDIDSAWQSLGHAELIAEAFVTFSRELSVIAARDQHGHTVVYPLAENQHHAGILRVSRVPAPDCSDEKQAQARQFITTLLDHLNHIGVLTLELFDTASGLVANEMAPRVHNSGHWSIEGAETSQFENHVRAICGFPLGSTQNRHSHAAMINIIGKNGDRNSVLNEPAAHLHMYGKSERSNRKLGHINIVADSAAEMESVISKLHEFVNECG